MRPGRRSACPRSHPRATDQRVLQRDSQLVESGLRLLELRAREIELSQRRLIPRFGVIERLLRKQLTLEQAPRSIEVGLRELQIRVALPDRRFADLERRLGLPHLFPDLAVFDERDDLPTAHRVAKLDVDRLQPAVDLRHDLHRGRADQVADDQDLLGHGRPVDRPQTRPASAAGHTTSSAAAARATAAGGAGLGRRAAASPLRL